MQNTLRKPIAFLIIFAMVVTAAFALSVDNVQAASKPTKISLTKAATYVDIGAKLKVSVKSVSPKSASKTVSWSISKGSKYGGLTDKGKTSVNLLGKKAGTVTVKATSKSNKRVSKTIKVTVKNLRAEKVTMSAKTATVKMGDSQILKATVKKPQKGIGYTSQKTTWKSSNDEVATVDQSGKVTALTAGTAVITATNDGKSDTCAVTVPTNTLRAYVMVGYYSTQKLNKINLDKDAGVVVWNSDTEKFKSGTKNKSTILGNFVQLEDSDNDGDADIIKVVKREDSESMWNKKMAWKDGVGYKYPEISDEDARSVFKTEYRIPFGERLLDGFGIGSYCGVNDYKNYENSPYWPTYDYYNMESGENLILLEGYRTTAQTTGSMCVMSSALSVLDWYGVRGDLNEHDLGTLRSENKWGGGTSLNELITTFEKLDELDLAGDENWVLESWNDDSDKLYDTGWIKGHLEQGHPIMVIWNSYGAHGQVIIGYDDRGTPVTADDQLIMMDPYDTTDHDNDGYTIQSYERLAYGTLSWEGDVTGTKFLVAYPDGWNWEPSDGSGIADVVDNTKAFTDANKLNDKLLEQTKIDILRDYSGDIVDPSYNPTVPSVGGAWAYENFANYEASPFYSFHDYFNYENGTDTDPTDTLQMLKEFKTVQQSTEWTCGTTSALMVMEWFNKNTGETPLTDITLAKMRQNGDRGATYLSGMEEMFSKLNADPYNQDWVTFSIDDADYDPEWEANFIGDYALEWGRADAGLIPYLIDNGIPMMIGWDEWGGHWQVIVGYDDMGTYETQDDVIILADPYDTTDHDCDGYVVESFERLVYGWNSNFEGDDGGPIYDDFIVAFPEAGNQDIIDELGLVK